METDDTPDTTLAENIKASVLVLHGGADPYVPQKQVNMFWNEMQNAQVDWQMHIYGNAVHSFSDPFAGDDPSVGAAYNEQADKRSWEAMTNFFHEIFAK